MPITEKMELWSFLLAVLEISIAVPGIFSTKCHIFWESGGLFVYGKGNNKSGFQAGRSFELGTDSTKNHISGGSSIE